MRDWPAVGHQKAMQTSSGSQQLLQSVQASAARIAIGSSSMRGAGSAGVVMAARAHLLRLPLKDFGTPDADAFRNPLDGAT